MLTSVMFLLSDVPLSDAHLSDVPLSDAHLSDVLPQ